MIHRIASLSALYFSFVMEKTFTVIDEGVALYDSELARFLYPYYGVDGVDLGVFGVHSSNITRMAKEISTLLTISLRLIERSRLPA